MRIGIDATCWSNRRGFGRFARELLWALARLETDDTYVLFADRQTAHEAAFPPGWRVVVGDTAEAPAQAAAADGRHIKAKHLKRWTLWNLLKTDIFDRGVPWTRLMLRAGSIVNTLNIKPTQRLSVVLVYLMGLSACLGIWWPLSWMSTVLFALMVTVINWDFYHYFAVRSGVWFTVRVAPLHWLYFGYCGLCVILGTSLHYLTEVIRLSSFAIFRPRSNVSGRSG